MRSIVSVALRGMLLCLGLAVVAMADAAPTTGVTATLVRSGGLAGLPQVRLRNGGATAARVTVAARLEQPSGAFIRQASAGYTLAPDETRTVPAYAGGPKRITGAINLVRITVHTPGAPDTALAALCGSPRPVARGMADMFAMNVHLERFDDDHVWKVLQMLKAAGVTSTRIEMGFAAPNTYGGYGKALTSAEREVLLCEAFGIEPVGCLNYFPAELFLSPEKLRMAHDWSAALAKHYQGRVTSWEFGNETNSGWGAYGAAADMTALNIAFARGTLSVDPHAKVAPVGVAEAESGYVQTMLEGHIGEYANVLCIHPYGGTAEASAAQCLRIRQIARAHGFDGEIWADEVGFQYGPGGRINKTTGQPVTDNGYSPDQQGDQLARLLVLSKSYGIDRVFWYDFYALNDPETFWIVNEDFSPRPAYTAMVNTHRALQDTMSIGGTDYDELVQRHYFRNKDGSVTLIAWALQDGVPAGPEFPRGLPAKDILGAAVATGGALTLGNRPIIVTGLSSGDIRSFTDHDVLANALDERTFNAPQHRWRIDPGASFDVPCVVYNTSDHTVQAQPVALRTNPGWTIAAPDAFAVAPGQTVTKTFHITAPADAVHGVEYRFDLAAAIDGQRRTTPYGIRVKTNGDFPYDAILAGRGRPDYPMWDPFDETGHGTGQKTLSAKRGSATIDGDLSDWSPEEFHPIDQKLRWILRDPWQPDQGDWSGRVALRWDDRNLYAAFLVLDDHLSLIDFTSRDWRDNDYVRLFLSTEGDPAKRADLVSENDYNLFMAPTGIAHTEAPVVYCASIGGYVHGDVESRIKLASRVWAGGYIVEAAVPFSAMRYTPKAGAQLGLNVMAVDADYGHRQIEAMTYYKDPGYWNSPKTLGQLTLAP